MYIPDQQRQQPHQTMNSEMLQAMLQSMLYSAIVAGLLAAVATLGYYVVQLSSRDSSVTTNSGSYGDIRYIYSMTAPPIPYVISEAAAQTGQAHRDIHTPTHGTSQLSMKELYTIMRTSLFSSKCDNSYPGENDQGVSQYSSLLGNSNAGHGNGSMASFGRRSEIESNATGRDGVAGRCAP